MRRAVCLANPSFVYAGQVGTWKFSYTSPVALYAGGKCKFDLQTHAGFYDWQIPEISPDLSENAIWMELSSGEILVPELVEKLRTYEPTFEFTFPIDISAGDSFSIFLGTIDPKKQTSQGNRAQTFIQRRRAFHIYVNPKGKGEYKDYEVFTLDIRGEVLDHVKLLTPSLVGKNTRFDVVLRFEDIFGNLTSRVPKEASERMLLELTYENLRENLSWKLFVPETGFLILPNLYFNEIGDYRIQLNAPEIDKTFISTPIKCASTLESGLYWGVLHGESLYCNSTDQIEDTMRILQDEDGYQFYATSPFEAFDEISSEDWKAISSQISLSNEAERFSALLGFQWTDIEEKELFHILYAKDNKALLRAKDLKHSTVENICTHHSAKELCMIPSFSIYPEFSNSLMKANPAFTPVVEIYNAWGSSECLLKEGNTHPIQCGDQIFESQEGSVRHALNKGMRLGFTAGGYDDRGVYSEFCSGGYTQYTPGATAIYSQGQSRDSLWQALMQRSCYATTGAQIFLNFNIAEMPMGSELNLTSKPGLAYVRYITAEVAGTEKIKEITLICNGEPLKTERPESHLYQFVFEDTRPLNTMLLSSKLWPSFAYYYLRVEQEDGHVAWSSPIWIDAVSHNKKNEKPQNKG